MPLCQKAWQLGKRVPSGLFKGSWQDMVEVMGWRLVGRMYVGDMKDKPKNKSIIVMGEGLKDCFSWVKF